MSAVRVNRQAVNHCITGWLKLGASAQINCAGVESGLDGGGLFRYSELYLPEAADSCFQWQTLINPVCANLQAQNNQTDKVSDNQVNIVEHLGEGGDQNRGKKRVNIGPAFTRWPKTRAQKS